MPILKVICRVDFEPNFEMFDSPGKIMQILHKKEFLPDLGEDLQSGRIIVGKYSSENNDCRRIVNITPISLDFLFESLEGPEKDHLDSSDDIRNLMSILDEVRRTFRISKNNRTGIRCFYFSKLSEDTENLKNAFKRILNNDVIGFTEESLGKIKDIGLVAEGINEDGTGYFFRCGPYLKGENKAKEYTKLNNKLLEEKNYNFIADLDIFERNHELSYDISLRKWAFPVLSNKINKFLSYFEEFIKNKME